MPVAQQNASSRHDVGRAEREGRLEDRWVRLLLHEQRYVLERIVVVHSETAMDNVLALAIQVIGKAHAWAEALRIIVRLFCDQSCRQRTEWRCCLQFLEGAAVSDVGSADEIKVPVITEAKVHRQTLAELPVILEI